MKTLKIFCMGMVTWLILSSLQHMANPTGVILCARWDVVYKTLEGEVFRAEY